MFDSKDIPEEILMVSSSCHIEKEEETMQDEKEEVWVLFNREEVGSKEVLLTTACTNTRRRFPHIDWCDISLFFCTKTNNNER